MKVKDLRKWIRTHYFSPRRWYHCIRANGIIFCTVNSQHTSRQDAIITIRLYLATCFNCERPSSGQLRTILRYFNIVLSWHEVGRSRPKHVAKYNLIVIIASFLDICFLLTEHTIVYKLWYTQRDGLSRIYRTNGFIS